MILILFNCRNIFTAEKQCGRVQKSTAFVAGSQNDDEINPVGQWPWMASIGYYDENNKWNHQCGTTLISNNMFITAAHCIDDQLNDDLDR